MCLEEHFFYVADFEVTLEMSVKLAGSETYSFHGNNTGEGSEFLIPKQRRRGFRISDPPNNTYILLEGLVCSIVRYFYESRCILASPRVQIQETSRNRTH